MTSRISNHDFDSNLKPLVKINCCLVMIDFNPLVDLCEYVGFHPLLEGRAGFGICGFLGNQFRMWRHLLIFLVGMNPLIKFLVRIDSHF